MTFMRRLFVPLLMFQLFTAGYAPASAQVPVIMGNLNDSASCIRVVQPPKLEERLASSHAVVESETTNVAETSNAGTARVGGYRIQVFSDNNQRTAKNEARSKARMLSEAFPEYATYVIFQSPFWRLKVGDFRTQDDAENAADVIRAHFPSFAREIRVVKDRINR